MDGNNTKKTAAEKQREADLKWRAKNKPYRSYLSSRSSARSFIRNHATVEDLDELDGLIKDRRTQLKEQE